MKAGFLLCIRLILGGSFLYLGWVKTQDPVAFLKVIREFELIGDHRLMNMVAAWLPWFEVWCGLLMLLGLGVRATATVMSLLLGAFTFMILHRALGLVDSSGPPFCDLVFDCGCGSGEVGVCSKIFQNSLLLGGAILLAWAKPRRWCLWPSITMPPSLDKPKKMALREGHE